MELARHIHTLLTIALLVPYIAIGAALLAVIGWLACAPYPKFRQSPNGRAAEPRTRKGRDHV